MTDTKQLAVSGGLPETQAEAISSVIKELMTPVVEAMAKMLEHNTQALDQLAIAQTVQNDRLEALEKQIRLNTLVTPQQVRYFNDAIRKRAREILFKRLVDEDDAKAVRSLSGMIRKAVLTRYGIGALHDVPKHEYAVVLSQVQMWNDVMCVRDVVKEARARAESDPVFEPGAGADG